MLAAPAAYAFQALGIAATLHSQGVWRPLYAHPSLVPFEIEHGLEMERDRYNKRSIRLALSGKLVHGEHAGLCDLFVPIVVANEVVDVLVVGPFLSEAPSAANVGERWRALSGQRADPADPEFLRYLTVTFSTLVVPKSALSDFTRLVTGMSELLGGGSETKALLEEVETLRTRLGELRRVEEVWEHTRSMVDPGSSRSWASAHRRHGLWRQGLRRPPDQVLACLLVTRQKREPLEELVSLHDFQRASVALARQGKETVSGRIGARGVMFLSAAAGSLRDRRQRLLEMLEKATRLARRHGFELHSGLSALPRSVPLNVQYEAALSAAETALAQGKRLVLATRTERERRSSLHVIRRELSGIAPDKLGELPARFERYLEAVAVRWSHRLEPSAADAVAGLERIVDAVVNFGSVSEPIALGILERLEHAATDSRSLNDVFESSRRALSDLIEAAEHPVSAQRDHGLRRALEHIHKHYQDPLSLEQVARVSGFAPNYFSVLFKRREGTTFEAYLFTRRLERAKQLLAGTELSVERVAELSGFRGREYLARVFRKNLAQTPLAFRAACMAGLPHASSPTFPKRPVPLKSRRQLSKVQD